jgi:hypothetical protein
MDNVNLAQHTPAVQVRYTRRTMKAQQSERMENVEKRGGVGYKVLALTKGSRDDAAEIDFDILGHGQAAERSVKKINTAAGEEEEKKKKRRGRALT